MINKKDWPFANKPGKKLHIKKNREIRKYILVKIATRDRQP